MTLLTHTQHWIERAWIDMGASFKADHVPVVQFETLDVNNIGYAFKTEGIASWLLEEGKLRPDNAARITKVPYIAFSLLEPEQKLHIQVQWAVVSQFENQSAFFL